jgi:hypothetical protein
MKAYATAFTLHACLDLSAAAYADLASGNAGAVLLLVPARNASLTSPERESVQALEEHLLTTETELPLYLAQETTELNEFLEVLRDDAEGTEATSAAKGINFTFIEWHDQLLSEHNNDYAYIPFSSLERHHILRLPARLFDHSESCQSVGRSVDRQCSGDSRQQQRRR